MSNERNTTGPDGVADERVSNAYGELATERAPEHVNEAVLRNAAKAARPSYQRSILWTRPVAWVAVVAICLAITLQVTQVPTPNGVAELADWEQDDGAIAPDASEKTDAASEAAAKMVQKQSPARELTRDQPATDAPVMSEDESPSGRRRGSVEQDRQAATPAEPGVGVAAAPLPEDFDMQDGTLLRRAEELRQLRAGDNKEADQVAVGVTALAAPASAAASLEATSCTDDDRQDPQTWLVCITLLERAGRTEEAAYERDQLSEAFADFELPARTE